MSFNLKNYTTSQPVEKTISFIEAYLASAGVTGITKTYEAGMPSAIYFHYRDPDDGDFTVRLPAKVKEVHEFIWNDYVSSRVRPLKQREDFLDQAGRIAWKIQSDWVQVQISLIKLKQAKFVEVFMGYLWDGQKSAYEHLKERKFKGLIGNGPQS